MKNLLIVISLMITSVSANAEVLVHKDAFGEKITHIASIVSHERNMLIFVCFPEGNYQANMYGNRAYHEPRVELDTRLSVDGGNTITGLGSAIRNNQGVALDVPSSNALLSGGTANLFAQGLFADAQFSIEISKDQVTQFKASCEQHFGIEFG